MSCTMHCTWHTIVHWLLLLQHRIRCAHRLCLRQPHLVAALGWPSGQTPLAFIQSCQEDACHVVSLVPLLCALCSINDACWYCWVWVPPSLIRSRLGPDSNDEQQKRCRESRKWFCLLLELMLSPAKLGCSVNTTLCTLASQGLEACIHACIMRCCLLTQLLQGLQQHVLTGACYRLGHMMRIYAMHNKKCRSDMQQLHCCHPAPHERPSSFTCPRTVQTGRQACTDTHPYIHLHARCNSTHVSLVWVNVLLALLCGCRRARKKRLFHKAQCIGLMQRCVGEGSASPFTTKMMQCSR